ncbi:MAG: hypothetical protein KAR47_14700 [Planctomycetes bacterium]|nr:hypothetical protein [Planctomycetota bacterium]
MGRVGVEVGSSFFGLEVPGGEVGGRRGDAAWIEFLRGRAESLVGEDRALVLMYLEGQGSVSQIAQLAGVGEAAIYRKVGAIMQRLVGGSYMTCVRGRCQLGRLEMAIARDYLVRRLSQSAIASSRGVSIYRVRKAIDKVERIVTAANEKQA